MKGKKRQQRYGVAKSELKRNLEQRQRHWEGKKKLAEVKLVEIREIMSALK